MFPALPAALTSSLAAFLLAIALVAAAIGGGAWSLSPRGRAFFDDLAAAMKVAGTKRSAASIRSGTSTTGRTTATKNRARRSRCKARERVTTMNNWNRTEFDRLRARLQRTRTQRALSALKRIAVAVLLLGVSR
jgi:hypothetical protein